VVVLLTLAVTIPLAAALHYRVELPFLWLKVVPLRLLAERAAGLWSRRREALAGRVPV
jgi:hypothetical protein